MFKKSLFGSLLTFIFMTGCTQKTDTPFTIDYEKYTLSNGLHFKVMQSLFPYSKRPGFKQFPWIWKGSSKVNKEVEVVAKYYEESLDNAETYYEILKSSSEGKEKIKWLKRVYGLENK